MNTGKIEKYHNKLYKYFRKILYGNKEPEEKLSIYKKLLKIIREAEKL